MFLDVDFIYISFFLDKYIDEFNRVVLVGKELGGNLVFNGKNMRKKVILLVIWFWELESSKLVLFIDFECNVLEKEFNIFGI